MARCGSCNARIVWAQTESGSSIPIEADQYGDPAGYPDTGQAGRIQEVEPAPTLFDPEPDTTGRTIVRVLGREGRADPGRPIWLSHFVSCPQATEWSRR